MTKAQYNREYYLAHRDAIRAKTKKLYRLNPDKSKAYSKAYHQAYKEILNEKHRDYVVRNRRKIYDRHREWRRENPEICSAMAAKRKARKLEATVNAESSNQFYLWVKNQDYLTCTYCGVYMSARNARIDHIIPLSKGGPHDPDNFAISCNSCNSSKGAKLLSEWPGCPEKFKSN